MAVVNGYLTTSEAGAYIGRQYPDGSGILDDIVTSVSRMIDQHCGRHFYQATATRLFDAQRVDRLWLGPHNDLVSVTTLKGDDNNDGVYEVTFTTTQYQLLPVGAAARAPYPQPFTSIEMLSTNEFPTYDHVVGRRGLIEIVGVWGWPAVPIEVKQAARILVAEVAKLQDAPLGVAGQSDFGVFRVPSMLPPRARQMLAPLVHPMYVGIA